MKQTNPTPKNFIIIAILAFVSFTNFADDNNQSINILGIIDIHGSIELGYLLRAGDLVSHYNKQLLDSRNEYNYDYNPYFDIGAYFTFLKALKVGGSIRSVFSIENLVSYVPLLDRYTIFAELFLFDHMHLGFLHYCEHTSIPYFDFYQQQAIDTLDRSEERFYVRFEF